MSILYVDFLCILGDMRKLIDGFVRYIVHLFHKDQCDMLQHKLGLHIFQLLDILDHFYIEEW